MEAIREIRFLKDKKITIELPETFLDTQVEIVVLKISTEKVSSGEKVTEKRRSPSVLLKNTEILGNITTSPIGDTDWDVLK